MNPWIVVGCLLNVLLGVCVFWIDSFGLLKSSPGFSQLFVPSKYADILVLGMGVWYFGLLISLVGMLLVLFKRKGPGALLLMVGGAMFFPLGLIQCKGALSLLDREREGALQKKLQVDSSGSEAMETSYTRRLWVAWFDLGFGLLLALASLGLVLYSNYQNFFRKLPAFVPKDVILHAGTASYASAYFLLGLAFLLSFYLAGLFWLVWSLQISFAVGWKVLTSAFLSGPTASLAFAFGVALFLIGVATLRRPFLQLYEHYFSLRPHFFSRRLYSTYKQIEQVEESDDEKVILQLPINGKSKRIKLPLQESTPLSRKHLVNAFLKRREAQW